MRAGLPVLLAFAFLLPSFPVLAQSGCPVQARTSPKVTILIDPASVTYRNDVNQVQLTDISQKQRRTGYGGNKKQITVGLTRAEGGYEVYVATGPIYGLRRNTQFCGALGEIKVKLFFKSMLVNVASDYRPGSCEYTAIIDHENKHVAIYRRNMDIYSRQIKAELERAVARFGVVTASSQQGVLDQYVKEAGRIITPLMNELHDQAERDHARLDSPESYRYSQGLCKGWKM
jgi:hypothetical protein